MSEREPFPTEDLEPRDREEPDSIPSDAPEADALEQARGTRPEPDESPAHVDDAPEADALEQAAPAGEPDEDDRH